jgi:UDP-glucose 4-epimerase
MKTDNTCVFLPHVKHENWQHMCFSSSCKTWKLTTHVFFLPHVKLTTHMFFFLMSNMRTDNTCVFVPHVKHKNWQHMCFSSSHQTWTLTTHVFLPHVKHENWQHMCFSSSCKNWQHMCFSSSDKHENWQQMCFSYSCQTWKLTTNMFFFLFILCLHSFYVALLCNFHKNNFFCNK